MKITKEQLQQIIKEELQEEEEIQEEDVLSEDEEIQKEGELPPAITIREPLEADADSPLAIVKSPKSVALVVGPALIIVY